METPQHDIEIRQGATFALALAYNEPDGTPVNLTGYSARMQVRERVGGRVWADLSTTAGSIAIDPLTGGVSVTIEASATRSMPAGRLVYDLFLIAPGGFAVCLVEGVATVIAAVTR